MDVDECSSYETSRITSSAEKSNWLLNADQTEAPGIPKGAPPVQTYPSCCTPAGSVETKPATEPTAPEQQDVVGAGKVNSVLPTQQDSGLPSASAAPTPTPSAGADLLGNPRPGIGQGPRPQTSADPTPPTDPNAPAEPAETYPAQEPTDNNDPPPQTNSGACTPEQQDVVGAGKVNPVLPTQQDCELPSASVAPAPTPSTGAVLLGNPPPTVGTGRPFQTFATPTPPTDPNVPAESAETFPAQEPTDTNVPPPQTNSGAAANKQAPEQQNAGAGGANSVPPTQQDCALPTVCPTQAPSPPTGAGVRINQRPTIPTGPIGKTPMVTPTPTD